MNYQKQDIMAGHLIDALDRDGRLTPEARAVLMRVCSGHERRTVGLLSMALAAVRRCHEPDLRHIRVSARVNWAGRVAMWLARWFERG
jgi:hypothetical protein